ncbi:MAG: putative sugar nucleotidyl transferase [Planctomycetaceae bacterium]|nr:putative sugar nucleotidyl transferase [Planctomycetaceae bacterium]
MRVAFFEDDAANQFSPLTLLRPVCELLCGHFSVRERALRGLPVTEWGALIRDFLVETYQETHPEAQINHRAWLGQGSTLLINSRWLCDPRDLARCDPDAAGIIDGEVAWVTLEPLETPLLFARDFSDGIAQLARTRRRVKSPGRMVKYPWELIDHNPAQITLDHHGRSLRTPRPLPPHVAVVGRLEDLWIDPTAEIDPFVVVDVRQGPVFIDAGGKVQAFTRIEGPCYVGRESQLFRTNLRAGSSIGPVCRVGGEVEASILQGYVNKYHDGFLGHALVGSWCNLGALTTNSDLKNDYSTVSVPLMGESIPTGQKKVGCFIGDHTKTAVGSLFNTGTSVGVMCQILPAGELLPKHIPSFTRVWHGEITDGFPMDACIATARAAMNRRNVELTDAQERLLRHVFNDTRDERQRAFDRQTQRRPLLAVSHA